jgi:hypothetical protein
MLAAFKNFIARLTGKKPQEQTAQEDELCCQGVVHIAYRGISDERLYLSYSRSWSEVRYFRSSNLRVFCAGCRRRLL